MSYSWETCTPNIKEFVLTVQNKINSICNRNVIGIYLHGSLAMGGFNPKQSDIDILVITNKPVLGKTKKELAKLFIAFSSSPYPIEISFLNRDQLHNWQHPCPFDFHFSEYWRKRYEGDLVNGTADFINVERNVDPDLAAHLTIIYHRGVCLDGKPIDEVFPPIPKNDYISSIMSDSDECFENILDTPIYCTLNLLRVLWFLKEGVISSKLEAGQWGLETMPSEFKGTIWKVVDIYSDNIVANGLNVEELLNYRNYIRREYLRLNFY